MTEHHLARDPTLDATEEQLRLQALLKAPSYRRAELDTDFLNRDELRPVRMQLELLKPELALAERHVASTIVLFGGARIVDRERAEIRLKRAEEEAAAKPGDAKTAREVEVSRSLLAKARYYDEAREFAKIVSCDCQKNDQCDYVIVTGGGPGIMEAGNRGSFDVGAKSIGLNITLPHEQLPNPYITPELCFQFRYFALRKMHFLLRAAAVIYFPGGYGTLDELFETLTLRQVGKLQQIPIILYGREYWDRIIDFQALADEGVIADEDIDLLAYAETPVEAWRLIKNFHERNSASTPKS